MIQEMSTSSRERGRVRVRGGNTLSVTEKRSTDLELEIENMTSVGTIHGSTLENNLNLCVEEKAIFLVLIIQWR